MNCRIPFLLVGVLLLLLAGWAEGAVRAVYSVQPSVGSMAGGTELTIKGAGFSTDWLNGGTAVYIGGESPAYAAPDRDRECRIDPDRSSPRTIVCTTPPLPSGEENVGSYSEQLTVHVWIDVLHVVSRERAFRYRWSNTPILWQPYEQYLAVRPGEPLVVRGDWRSYSVLADSFQSVQVGNLDLLDGNEGFRDVRVSAGSVFGLLEGEREGEMEEGSGRLAYRHNYIAIVPSDAVATVGNLSVVMGGSMGRAVVSDSVGVFVNGDKALTNPAITSVIDPPPPTYHVEVFPTIRSISTRISHQVGGVIGVRGSGFFPITPPTSPSLSVIRHLMGTEMKVEDGVRMEMSIGDGKECGLIGAEARKAVCVLRGDGGGRAEVMKRAMGVWRDWVEGLKEVGVGMVEGIVARGREEVGRAPGIYGNSGWCFVGGGVEVVGYGASGYFFDCSTTTTSPITYTIDPPTTAGLFNLHLLIPASTPDYPQTSTQHRASLRQKNITVVIKTDSTHTTVTVPLNLTSPTSITSPISIPLTSLHFTTSPSNPITISVLPSTRSPSSLQLPTLHTAVTGIAFTPLSTSPSLYHSLLNASSTPIASPTTCLDPLATNKPPKSLLRPLLSQPTSATSLSSAIQHFFATKRVALLSPYDMEHVVRSGERDGRQWGGCLYGGGRGMRVVEKRSGGIEWGMGVAGVEEEVLVRVIRAKKGSDRYRVLELEGLLDLPSDGNVTLSVSYVTDATLTIVPMLRPQMTQSFPTVRPWYNNRASLHPTPIELQKGLHLVRVLARPTWYGSNGPTISVTTTTPSNPDTPISLSTPPLAAPAAFFRTTHSSPQLTIRVNGRLAACDIPSGCDIPTLLPPTHTIHNITSNTSSTSSLYNNSQVAVIARKGDQLQFDILNHNHPQPPTNTSMRPSSLPWTISGVSLLPSKPLAFSGDVKCGRKPGQEGDVDFACEVGEVVAGTHPLTVLLPSGHAISPPSSQFLRVGVFDLVPEVVIGSPLVLTAASPNRASVLGGALMKIHGYGFSRIPWENVVTIGDRPCRPFVEPNFACRTRDGASGVECAAEDKEVWHASYFSIACITPAATSNASTATSPPSTAQSIKVTVLPANSRDSNPTARLDDIRDRGLWPSSEGEQSTTQNSVPSFSTDSFPDAFLFDLNRTAIVSDVQPSTGPPGTQILLTGSGFWLGQWPDEEYRMTELGYWEKREKVAVRFGGAPCVHESHRSGAVFNDTHLTCTITSNAGGTYPADVTVFGAGRARSTSLTTPTSTPTYTYALHILGATPTVASIYGGALVTLDVVGLPKDSTATRVRFGADPWSMVDCFVREVNQAEGWVTCRTGPKFDPELYNPDSGEAFDSPWLFGYDIASIGHVLDHEKVPAEVAVTWTGKEYATVCGEKDCALPPCVALNCTLHLSTPLSPRLTSVTILSSPTSTSATHSVAAPGDYLRLSGSGWNSTTIESVLITQDPNQVAGDPSAPWRGNHPSLPPLRQHGDPSDFPSAHCDLLGVEEGSDGDDGDGDDGDDGDDDEEEEESAFVLCRLRSHLSIRPGAHSVRVRVKEIGDTDTKVILSAPVVTEVLGGDGRLRSEMAMGGGSLVQLVGEGLLWSVPGAGSNATNDAINASLAHERRVRDERSTSYPITIASDSFIVATVNLPATESPCDPVAYPLPSNSSVSCRLSWPRGSPDAYAGPLDVKVGGVPAECRALGGCVVGFSPTRSPQVFLATPTSLQPHAVIVLEHFSSFTISRVAIGVTPCKITSTNSSHTLCSVHTRTPGGLHPISASTSDGSNVLFFNDKDPLAPTRTITMSYPLRISGFSLSGGPSSTSRLTVSAFGGAVVSLFGTGFWPAEPTSSLQHLLQANTSFTVAPPSAEAAWSADVAEEDEMVDFLAMYPPQRWEDRAYDASGGAFGFSTSYSLRPTLLFSNGTYAELALGTFSRSQMHAYIRPEALASQVARYWRRGSGSANLYVVNNLGESSVAKATRIQPWSSPAEIESLLLRDSPDLPITNITTSISDWANTSSLPSLLSISFSTPIASFPTCAPPTSFTPSSYANITSTSTPTLPQSLHDSLPCEESSGVRVRVGSVGCVILSLSPSGLVCALLHDVPGGVSLPVHVATKNGVLRSLASAEYDAPLEVERMVVDGEGRGGVIGSGSVDGGQKIRLIGRGFSSTPHHNLVLLHSPTSAPSRMSSEFACTVEEASYWEVRCRVPPLHPNTTTDTEFEVRVATRGGHRGGMIGVAAVGNPSSAVDRSPMISWWPEDPLERGTMGDNDVAEIGKRGWGEGNGKKGGDGDGEFVWTRTIPNPTSYAVRGATLLPLTALSSGAPSLPFDVSSAGLRLIELERGAWHKVKDARLFTTHSSAEEAVAAVRWLSEREDGAVIIVSGTGSFAANLTPSLRRALSRCGAGALVSNIATPVSSTVTRLASVGVCRDKDATCSRSDVRPGLPGFSPLTSRNWLFPDEDAISPDEAAGLMKWDEQVQFVSESVTLMRRGQFPAWGSTELDDLPSPAISSSICAPQGDTAALDRGSWTDANRDVRLEVSMDVWFGKWATSPTAYTYSPTSSITLTSAAPLVSSTAGGATIHLHGSGLQDVSSVQLGGGIGCEWKDARLSSLEYQDTPLCDWNGVECGSAMVNDTYLACITAPTGSNADQIAPQTGPIRAMVPGIGEIRVKNGGMFRFVDRWSARTTWGGADPPGPQEAVVIPKGVSVLLDTSPPPLSFIVVQGELIFSDELDLELRAGYIFVRGGVLRIGSATRPHQHRAVITLTGTRRAYSIPLYGAKVLALREGRIELHGNPTHHTPSWTRLGAHGREGDTTLTLHSPVDWTVGSEILVAATDHWHDEAEKRRIVDISDDKMTLYLDEPLQFPHHSTNLSFPVYHRSPPVQSTDALSGTLPSKTSSKPSLVELLRGFAEQAHRAAARTSKGVQPTDQSMTHPAGMRSGYFGAEVALLERNVVVQGDEDSRVGFFGAQIHVLSPEDRYGPRSAAIRMSNVMLRRMGQAFWPRRHPILLSAVGDMTGSYVRSVVIDEAYNRGVVLDRVDGVLVEDVVMTDVRGHGFVVGATGLERGNVIRNNLVAVMRPSWSSALTEQTPAGFFIRSPSNFFEGNVVAGSSHHGYWIVPPQTADADGMTGLYADLNLPAVCPRFAPLGSFRNNVAHSIGGAGVLGTTAWQPREDGLEACKGALVPSIATLRHTQVSKSAGPGIRFRMWGAVILQDTVTVDTVRAGIEAEWWGGPASPVSPAVHRALLVDRSENAFGGIRAWAGVALPGRSGGVMVDDVVFVGFNRSIRFCAGCSALRTAGALKSGYEHFAANLTFLPTPPTVPEPLLVEDWVTSESEVDGLTGEEDGYMDYSATHRLLAPNAHDGVRMSLGEDYGRVGVHEAILTDLDGSVTDSPINSLVSVVPATPLSRGVSACVGLPDVASPGALVCPGLRFRRVAVDQVERAYRGTTLRVTLIRRGSGERNDWDAWGERIEFPLPTNSTTSTSFPVDRALRDLHAVGVDGPYIRMPYVAVGAPVEGYQFHAIEGAEFELWFETPSPQQFPKTYRISVGRLDRHSAMMRVRTPSQQSPRPILPLHLPPGGVIDRDPWTFLARVRAESGVSGDLTMDDLEAELRRVEVTEAGASGDAFVANRIRFRYQYPSVPARMLVGRGDEIEPHADQGPGSLATEYQPRAFPWETGNGPLHGLRYPHHRRGSLPVPLGHFGVEVGQGERGHMLLPQVKLGREDPEKPTSSHSITYTAWMRPDVGDQSGDARFIDFGVDPVRSSATGGRNDVFVGPQSGDPRSRLKLNIYTDDTKWWAYTSYGLVPGAWTHFALVIDCARPRAQIFLNGTAVLNVATRIPLLVDRPHTLVGRATNGFQAIRPKPWRGVVDRVTLWSMPLNQAQVQILAAGGDPDLLRASLPPKVGDNRGGTLLGAWDWEKVESGVTLAEGAMKVAHGNNGVGLHTLTPETGEYVFDPATRIHTYLASAGTALKPNYITCPEEGCPPPPKEGSEPEPGVQWPPRVGYWSDPALWINRENQVPKDGEDVDIPPRWLVYLDVPTARIELLSLRGTLEFMPGRDLTLDARAIQIPSSGRLQVGNSTQPFYAPFRAIINLHASRKVPQKMILSQGGEVIMRGHLPERTHTRLSRTMYPGDAIAWVRGDVEEDWATGDEIVIASSTVNQHEREIAGILAASYDASEDETRLVLDTAVKFVHYGGEEDSEPLIDVAAPVGLLSRNVEVRGEEDGSTIGVVSLLTGSTRFEGVRFHRYGMLPSALLKGLLLLGSRGVRISKCSFTTGFNGVMQASGRGMDFVDNVVVDAVGTALGLEAKALGSWRSGSGRLSRNGGPSQIRGNLALVSGFNPGWEDVRSSATYRLSGVLRASEMVVHDNICAGAAQACYRLDMADTCDDTTHGNDIAPGFHARTPTDSSWRRDALSPRPLAVSAFSRNEASSCRIGVQVIRGCLVDRVKVHAASAYGVWSTSRDGLRVRRSVIADSRVAVGALPELQGVRVLVEDSVVIGESNRAWVTFEHRVVLKRSATSLVSALVNAFTSSSSSSSSTTTTTASDEDECEMAVEGSGALPRSDILPLPMVPAALASLPSVGSSSLGGLGNVGMLWAGFPRQVPTEKELAGSRMVEHTLITWPKRPGLQAWRNITFAKWNVTNACGRRQAAVAANPYQHYACHPIHTTETHWIEVEDGARVAFHEPRRRCGLEWCDGAKECVVKDHDGSFSGLAGGSVIPSAQDWPRHTERGCTSTHPDIREACPWWALDQPKILQVAANPSLQGILRDRTPAFVSEDARSRYWRAIKRETQLGSAAAARALGPPPPLVAGGEMAHAIPSLTAPSSAGTCALVDAWSAYRCERVGHAMLVIESLDSDTSLRRTAPLGLTDERAPATSILSGPMGLTTFWPVVPLHRPFRLDFTGTPPEHFRLHAIDALPHEVMIVEMWTPEARRLEVWVGRFFKDSYPLSHQILDSDRWDLVPHGANHFDRVHRILSVALRGDSPLEVRTSQYVQISLTIAVTVDEFFEEFFVRNLAAALMINPDRVRVAQIVPGNGRRLRRLTSSSSSDLVIEVVEADPCENDPCGESEGRGSCLLGGGGCVCEPGYFGPTCSSTSEEGSSGTPQGQQVDSGDAWEELVDVSETLESVAGDGGLDVGYEVEEGSLEVVTPPEPAPIPVDSEYGAVEDVRAATTGYEEWEVVLESASPGSWVYGALSLIVGDAATAPVLVGPSTWVGDGEGTLDSLLMDADELGAQETVYDTADVAQATADRLQAALRAIDAPIVSVLGDALDDGGFQFFFRTSPTSHPPRISPNSTMFVGYLASHLRNITTPPSPPPSSVPSFTSFFAASDLCASPLAVPSLYPAQKTSSPVVPDGWGLEVSRLWLAQESWDDGGVVTACGNSSTPLALSLSFNATTTVQVTIPRFPRASDVASALEQVLGPNIVVERDWSVGDMVDVNLTNFVTDPDTGLMVESVTTDSWSAHAFLVTFVPGGNTPQEWDEGVPITPLLTLPTLDDHSSDLAVDAVAWFSTLHSPISPLSSLPQTPTPPKNDSTLPPPRSVTFVPPTPPTPPPALPSRGVLEVEFSGVIVEMRTVGVDGISLSGFERAIGGLVFGNLGGSERVQVDVAERLSNISLSLTITLSLHSTDLRSRLPKPPLPLLSLPSPTPREAVEALLLAARTPANVSATVQARDVENAVNRTQLVDALRAIGIQATSSSSSASTIPPSSLTCTTSSQSPRPSSWQCTDPVSTTGGGNDDNTESVGIETALAVGLTLGLAIVAVGIIYYVYHYCRSPEARRAKIAQSPAVAPAQAQFIKSNPLKTAPY